jgi:predicted nucleic acid-binding Zn ribbon protein
MVVLARMSLSKYQLERADLTVTIEQGRRVENELFAENSRGLRTMGELLKARVFGSTQWAIDLRKRMTAYSPAYFSERDIQGPQISYEPHPQHGVMCECDDCEAAIKRLLKDVGVLPKKGGAK